MFVSIMNRQAAASIRRSRGLATHPFNPFSEFKADFRVIAADLRNAKDGQSSGPLEVDRPWDAYTDDHIGLMDHLGIRAFMVLGFCIGDPFIWNLLKRAVGHVPAAVPAHPYAVAMETVDLAPIDQPRQFNSWRPPPSSARRPGRTSPGYSPGLFPLGPTLN